MTAELFIFIYLFFFIPVDTTHCWILFQLFPQLLKTMCTANDDSLCSNSLQQPRSAQWGVRSVLDGIHFKIKVLHSDFLQAMLLTWFCWQYPAVFVCFYRQTTCFSSFCKEPFCKEPFLKTCWFSKPVFISRKTNLQSPAPQQQPYSLTWWCRSSSSVTWCLLWGRYAALGLPGMWRFRLFCMCVNIKFWLWSKPNVM